jgi:hypothetical protein
VREFTGDMQLTRKEAEEANLIVTTPEKWDVITRKAGEGGLATAAKLIIIDEVGPRRASRRVAATRAAAVAPSCSSRRRPARRRRGALSLAARARPSSRI